MEMRHGTPSQTARLGSWGSGGRRGAWRPRASDWRGPASGAWSSGWRTWSHRRGCRVVQRCSSGWPGSSRWCSSSRSVSRTRGRTGQSRTCTSSRHPSGRWCPPGWCGRTSPVAAVWQTCEQVGTWSFRQTMGCRTVSRRCWRLALVSGWRWRWCLGGDDAVGGRGWRGVHGVFLWSSRAALGLLGLGPVSAETWP